MTTIVAKQNNLTQTWTVAAGIATLVISGNIFFDMYLESIVRIYDVTTSTFLPFGPNTTFSNTFVAGLPTYTWVTTVPTGTVSGDTILVYIDVTSNQLTALQLQYQKA